MTIKSFYRGNTKVYRFAFTKPNPSYTGRPPTVVVTSAADGEFDEIVAPVIITSAGVVDDVWTLTFDNATEFTCAGATEGTVGQGNTTQDFAPYNTTARAEYFTLSFAGFSGVFQAADTVVFTTVRVNIPVDITDNEITLTFIQDGELLPTVQVTAIAGGDALDDIAGGIMYLTVVSGDSADLVAEEYTYGIERRIPANPVDIDLDEVTTLDAGSVAILTPAKVIAP